MNNDLIQRIRQAQIRAAEDAVIASIPKELKENMAKAQAKFEADGGCPGCGSKIIAVHYGNCSELRDDCY